MFNSIDRYLDCDNFFKKSINAETYRVFKLILDDLPETRILSYFDRTDKLDLSTLNRYGEDNSTLKRNLSSLIFINYILDNSYTFASQFYLFKNMEINKDLLLLNYQGNSFLDQMIEESFNSNSYELFNFIINNFDKDLIKLSKKNLLSFYTNKDCDIRILELIHNNNLLNLNNLPYYNTSKTLLEIVGSKNTRNNTVNEKLVKFVFTNNLDYNIEELHINYKKYINKLELAYKNKEENENNLLDLINHFSDFLNKPKDKTTLDSIDNILYKIDDYKSLITKYNDEINLGKIYEEKLNLESKDKNINLDF